jgi:predicted ATPase/DNA-binding CsgD family transcriptional regulator
MTQPGLPVQLTPFIGRSHEINDLTGLMADPACRLLTLVGPGGIGKSRLALEAARQQADRFRDGVFWVDLQPATTAELLVSALADALSLSLSGRSDPRQELLDGLQPKTALLVLDNFEQLREESGLLSEILAHAPGVSVLVTSQTALQLQEEWLYPLSGLPYPQGEQADLPWNEIENFDAVKLLVERVRRVRPGFSPPAERDGLLRICRLVEGLPLALELAAAWARSLDCAAIAAEIQGGLTFLSSNLRNLPRRHRSMQAVFAHSWMQLQPEEQAAFSQLAVFRGGFRREAAEAVAGTSLALLTSLVDRSLLRWQADGRYQMHTLLRQYTANQLDPFDREADQIQARHAAYYLDFLYRLSEPILGGRQREAAAEIAAELDNIRVAWQWAVQHQQVEATGRALVALSMFCQIRSRYLDASRMYEQALGGLDFSGPDRQLIRAQILLEMGWIAIRLGQFEKAGRMIAECRSIYQDLGMRPPPGQGTDPLLGLSALAAIGGDFGEAEALALQAYQVAVDQNHVNNLETINYQLASIAYARGDYEQARAYAQAAYEACQHTGDQWFMAYCLHELGRSASALGDYSAARRHFEAGYHLRESFSDPEGMALALHNLGDVALRQQRTEEAQDLFERSAAIYRNINDKGGLAAVQLGLGRAALARGDYESARQGLQQALAIAAGIRFTPQLLAILGSVGQFLLSTGRVEQGLTLLALASEHPAGDQETKTLARQMIRHYQGRVSPAMFSSDGQPGDLQVAVAAAQAVLTAAIPPLPEKSLKPPEVPSLVDPLTERELEVLLLLAQGLTNSEIAERLTVVLGTVKAHNNSIYSKLGVKNRATAILRARELGLIS